MCRSLLSQKRPTRKVEQVGESVCQCVFCAQVYHEKCVLYNKAIYGVIAPRCPNAVVISPSLSHHSCHLVVVIVVVISPSLSTATIVISPSFSCHLTIVIRDNVIVISPSTVVVISPSLYGETVVVISHHRYNDGEMTMTLSRCLLPPFVMRAADHSFALKHCIHVNINIQCLSDDIYSDISIS